jgi:hypothetical protein
MKCLTPEQTMSGNCEFLAANLYAKSMFGESALANLSIEVGKNGYVLGTSLFNLLLSAHIFRTHSYTSKVAGNGDLAWRQNQRQPKEDVMIQQNST